VLVVPYIGKDFAMRNKPRTCPCGFRSTAGASGVVYGE
jgi:hypothetical protein